MGKITQFVKKKIGKETYQFSVEGNNFHEVVLAAKNMSFNDVKECGCCQSDDLELTAHVAKGKFKYTLIKCKKCKAYLNFGQQQENPEIYYLRTKEEKTSEGKTFKKLDWKEASTPLEEN